MTKKNPFPLINSGQNILGKFNAKNLLLLNTYYSQPHGETPDVATIVFKDTSKPPANKSTKVSISLGNKGKICSNSLYLFPK